MEAEVIMEEEVMELAMALLLLLDQIHLDLEEEVVMDMEEIGVSKEVEEAVEDLVQMVVMVSA